MGSEGSRLAESERGVWFWLKMYSICTPHFNRKNELILFRGRKTVSTPQILEPRKWTTSQHGMEQCTSAEQPASPKARSPSHRSQRTMRRSLQTAARHGRGRQHHQRQHHRHQHHQYRTSSKFGRCQRRGRLGLVFVSWTQRSLPSATASPLPHPTRCSRPLLGTQR